MFQNALCGWDGALLCWCSSSLSKAAEADDDDADGGARSDLRKAVLHLYILNASSHLLALIHCAWNSCIIVSIAVCCRFYSVIVTCASAMIVNCASAMIVTCASAMIVTYASAMLGSQLLLSLSQCVAACLSLSAHKLKHYIKNSL